MRLQGNRLTMTGLGVHAGGDGGTIAMGLQPRMVDGIHLRWALRHDLGFPWYGFYLFRRHHRPGTPICLNAPFQLDTTVLEGRAYHRFQLPLWGQPAYRIELKVEFQRAGSTRVVAFHGEVPVDEMQVTGQAGDSAALILKSSSITAVALHDGVAQLAEICFVPVHQEADTAWEAVAGFPNPMCLPLTHPDYACTGGRDEDLATARMKARDRIRYGDPDAFAGPPATLYDQGTLHVQCGSAVAEGTGTDWHAGLVGALLQLDSEDTAYTIIAVERPVQVRLSRPYAGPSGLNKAYAIRQDPFGQLHDHLVHLVRGGSGAGAMSERTVAIPAPAADGAGDEAAAAGMPEQRPVDLILLAALHPAMAQMVGLYWVDESVVEGEAYDYLIVADWDGTFSYSPLLESLPEAPVDAYIVPNLKLETPDPLPAPTGLRISALPAGPVPGYPEAPDGGRNSAGLRWDLGRTESGDALLPDRPVLYHVWRSALGNGENPSAGGSLRLLTEDAPSLVAKESPSSAGPPPGWPPFRLHYIDHGLPDGWYAYRIHGVDIFGRHSMLSDPGPWHQWAPKPDPAPWYYAESDQEPESDVQIHPEAVRLLDKLAPPPPVAVEAAALDPADPMVIKDQAHQDWWGTLSDEERKTVVGLRVSWLWTADQMLQAPDTAEFRIYYHPGSDLPEPDHRDSVVWKQRYDVVGYDEHVNESQDEQGRPLRRYEVLLPAPGDQDRSGLPLAPDAAEPIDYAHAGVSAADDTAHTPDDPDRSGEPWGDRPGNEGRLGNPALVFRVLREPPADPVPPPADSDKVWASPANYHGSSSFTYRWLPEENLTAHIFRALDEAVFSADWALRPRGPLDANDLGLFPAEWQGGDETSAARRTAIAAELAALDDLSGNGSGWAEAAAVYRELSNDALRVLAGLPGNEEAFTQLTVQPLDPQDHPDRRGPDDPDDYIPDPGLCAYVDTLDGRTRNRYFYRAAYVDGAHNRSGLSTASPPVYLPRVVPPRRPAVTKVLGGDRRITLRWAANRDPDVAGYRIYRAERARDATDLRSMTLAHQISASNATDEGEEVFEWSDEELPGKVTFYYRLTAFDDFGNESRPCRMVSAQAYDLLPPPPPEWVRAEWVRLDEAGQEQSWDTDPPSGAAWQPGIVLEWSLDKPDFATAPERRPVGGATWRSLGDSLPPGTTKTYDQGASSSVGTYYRLKVWSSAGNRSVRYEVRFVPPVDE